MRRILVSGSVAVLALGGLGMADAAGAAPGPTISSLTRMSGPASGGTWVGVHGANLQSVTHAYFGATRAAQFQPLSATYARALAPKLPVGVVDVRLATPNAQTPVTIADRYFAGGPAFSSQSLPVQPDAPTQEIEIHATACGAPGFCAAGGWIGTHRTVAYRPLLDLYTGGRWVNVPLAPPEGEYAGSIEHVACTASSTCLALGYRSPYSDPSFDIAVAVQGGTASEVRLPGSTDWTADACAPGAGCAIAGVDGSTAPQVQLFDGATGAPQATAALPQGAVPTTVGGVVCSSAASCVLWGTATRGDAQVQYGEALDDGVWTSQLLPTPASYGAVTGLVEAGTCPRDASCTGYGTATAADGSSRPYRLDRMGSTVTAVPLTTTADPRATVSAAQVDVPVTGVSCASPTACIATSHHDGVTYVDRLRDDTWVVSAYRDASTGAGYESHPTGAACSGPSFCVAPSWAYTTNAALQTPSLALLRLDTGAAGVPRATLTMPSPGGRTMPVSGPAACAPAGRFCLVIGETTQTQYGTRTDYADIIAA